MWLTETLRLGMRVVVRYRVGDQATDALGDVVGLDEATVTVRTRKHGDVPIGWDTVVVAKPVPPAPARRGRPHRAIGMADLQELMVAGMPPLDSEWLGRWLLRTAEGYTGRGNSTLPLGDPGLPLDDALAHVERWYADRGQPALVQIYGPAGFDPAEDALGADLTRDGWRIFQKTLVMTAAAGEVAMAISPDPVPHAPTGGQTSSADPATRDGTSELPVRVTVTTEPGPAWWAGTSDRTKQHRATVEKVLPRIENGLYLGLTGTDGEALGAARVALTTGWAGVFDVHVTPAARRRGLGRRLVAEAARAAAARRIRSLYLQVGADNDAAVGLYRAMGFTVHHDYYYARRP